VNRETKSKANKSHKKESINRYKSTTKYFSKNSNMKMLRIFIWICCIGFLYGRALNIAERKQIDGNDSNSKYK